ncbi:RdgB/HAM1 family non-canonical purine NTP pyrophosphatase [Brevibacterium otitidis]|uniref:dITP/XTP pyrophosphatase n=1 Tax=Brevibacterium otitidis TaxID=53364 RepID=A0ABV5X2R9_9MICO|nr:RdgB/HAM1 family non-canonical purine NTP pyrophosphatase [Brevibacterium otitidis]
MFDRIVIATRNEGKRAELDEILRTALNRPITVLTAADVDLPEVVEDGVTFAANAELKARSAAAHTGLPAIADDSGLAVEVLGGAPGIFSARWSGRHGDDVANYELLLAQLADVPDEHRQAAFRCAGVFVDPRGGTEPEVVLAEGQMRGRLGREPVGEHGFGYDPIFYPDGYAVTTAQLSAEEKNAISHRGQALRALAQKLADRAD